MMMAAFGGNMKKQRKKRLGAVTVEVALTLPILLMFTFAGWEFSRINAMRNTLENAAYQAARDSMLPGATLAKVTAEANAVLDSCGIVNANIQMSPSVITTTTDDVTIDITAPIAANSLGLMRYFTSGNLSASITLSRELQPGRF